MLTTAPDPDVRDVPRRSARRAEPVVLEGLAGDASLFLSETAQGLDAGARFLDRLTADERALVTKRGRALSVRAGEAVFAQGDPHKGIFIIEQGRVRVFYTAPSGRQITLAYWTPGHFIGGPEVADGGVHVWSGEALDDCRILNLPSAALANLVATVPNFALCLIEGLVSKGKCYSSMAQMLGTRSVIERLAQFLLNLGELYGVREGAAIVVRRKVTHDQIAAMVGSTRQWVTMMLKRFQREGVVTIDARGIRIARPDRLQEIVFADRG
ncbi:Crp/Fnr family transcriptional regulator [Methylopila sp. M107]|uniref:Crp/Fnr family transcriptional regulator n=1 Tax=Methylopila sp. M107 TaxID=1101190 RepID=UPI0009DBD39D|nr:Crp/Fnr family transcriptional regulator [Methylopila sp. M107]